MTLTPKELAAFFKKAARKVLPAIMSAEKTTAKEALAAAKAASSGGSSLADLRAAGHPYSRQHPNPAYDAAIINAQTGAFRAGWNSTPPTASGQDTVTFHVVNASGPAKYMTGTSRMVARPVSTVIRKTVSENLDARVSRLRAAVSKVLSRP